MPAWVVDLLNRLNSTFVVDGRWQWFVSGLGYTLLISLFSVLLGLVIGILMALMRLSKSKILRAVSGIYIDIIRGTPTMVQLLIIYFVIFANVHIDKWVVGFIAFGINSGAYIAEIVRGGILSVNIGQTEAGRSLGMTHKQTMASIVMPQAMKNIGMIANIDLVGAARKVQSLTYDYLIPLLSIAVIYYVVIKIISTLLSKVEKGMRKADKR